MGAGLQRIDKHLIEMGLIRPDQIEEARLSSKGSRRPILDELVELGYLGDDDLIAAFLSADPSLKVADLHEVSVDQSLLSRVPYSLTQRHSALPLEVRDGQLIVAMTNPWDLMATDDLSLAAGEPVRPVLARRAELLEAIERFYCVDGSVYDLCKHMQADDSIEVTPADELDGRAVAQLETGAGDAPVVRLVNLIVADGLKQNASDIHIEPTSEKLIVRYRIDGVLRSVLDLPSRLTPAVTSRIKILAGMDIAERRRPQDGRIKVRRGGQEVDVRVSIIPVFTGEKAVLRLLTFAASKLSLDKLGFRADDAALFRDMLLRPQGMLLVTGPTGSGKTSTIYASLLALNDGVRNITTVEDPVEYQLDGINQIQINEAADVTFSSALRSILRQDPNVIFVGEIRDAETAEIAFRAAQTGHLVISTLHTNSAAAAYTRLIDIGIEPFLLSSSLLGIVGQRLVRRICEQCKTPHEPEPHDLQRLGEVIPPGSVLYRGTGCAACSYTGYHGRVPVFEILPVTDRIKQLISLNRPETQIMEVAALAGMKPMSARAAELVLEGVTAAGEAAAVCPTEIKRAAAPTALASPAYDPNPAPKIAAPTVLIVDDDPAIRLLFRRTFGRDPIEICEAENGEEGLRLAYKIKPSLIILDVMMPVMDGIEACRRLKSSVEMANIPVILATARTADDDEVEGLRAGADDYLVKPLMPEKLRLHVLKHLGKRYPALRTVQEHTDGTAHQALT